VSLAPFIILSVEELKSNYSLVDEFHIADVPDFLPILNFLWLKNFEGFLKVREIEGNCIRSTFFVGI